MHMEHIHTYLQSIPTHKTIVKKRKTVSWAWWCTFDPGTWRQRQADFFEFEASKVYIVSSTITRAM